MSGPREAPGCAGGPRWSPAVAPAGGGGPARADAVALSCVILTMGDRPAELGRAVRSVLDQAGAAVETVVVANGAELAPLPDDVQTVLLPRNVGIPAGRNAGVAACTGDVILFLDDDGWYSSRDLAAHVRRQVRRRPIARGAFLPRP